jgi:hypothetical protein
MRTHVCARVVRLHTQRCFDENVSTRQRRAGTLSAPVISPGSDAGTSAWSEYTPSLVHSGAEQPGNSTTAAPTLALCGCDGVLSSVKSDQQRTASDVRQTTRGIAAAAIPGAAADRRQMAKRPTYAEPETPMKSRQPNINDQTVGKPVSRRRRFDRGALRTIS